MRSIFIILAILSIENNLIKEIMGCSGASLLTDYQYESIKDPINFVLKPFKSLSNGLIDRSNEGIIALFTRASELIRLIENQRENAIDKLDEVILATGACLYSTPNITHCFRCLLYKMAYDLNGDIQLANITYTEDIPHMLISKDNVHNDTIEVYDKFVNYIEDVYRAKLAISQIEKMLSDLIYLQTENLPLEITESDHNRKIIDKAVKAFPHLKQFIAHLLQKYQYELRLFSMKNKSYVERVNFVGISARKEKEEEKDIYQVVYCYKKIMKKFPLEYKEEKMAFTIETGKMKYIDIIHSKKKFKEKMHCK